MITRFRKASVSHGLKSVPPVIVAPAVAPEAGPDASAAPAREPDISRERRLRMIAEAAYFRAERRGFAPGGESRDWLESEAEIEELLAAG